MHPSQGLIPLAFFLHRKFDFALKGGRFSPFFFEGGSRAVAVDHTLVIPFSFVLSL